MIQRLLGATAFAIAGTLLLMMGLGAILRVQALGDRLDALEARHASDVELLHRRLNALESMHGVALPGVPEFEHPKEGK